MRFCTDIKHDQTMRREEEPYIRLHFSRTFVRLKILIWQLCMLNKSETMLDILTNIGKDMKRRLKIGRD